MIIVRMEFGSTVYGTRLPTSDTDYKSVYIPTLRSLLMGESQKTIQSTTKLDLGKRSTAEDVEEECSTLQHYCKLLKQGQTVAVDMLFVPPKHITVNSPIWADLQNERHRFLHSGSASFVGYCRKQANKYGIKGSRVKAMRAFVEFLHGVPGQLRLADLWEDLAPIVTANWEHMGFHQEGPIPMIEVCNRKFGFTTTVKYVRPQAEAILAEYGSRALQAEANEGVDWKALMHAVRIANQAVELLTYHNVTFPRPEVETLLKIRKGELPYAQVAEMVEQGIENVEAAARASSLPKSADEAWINDFVFHTYHTHAR